jgi:hypothetical protein
MADIMIRCAIFGTAVPTGITTEMIILDTLTSSFRRSVRRVEKFTSGNAKTLGSTEREGAARADLVLLVRKRAV